MAVGHRELENFLERQLSKEFNFVGTTVYREGIIRAIGQKNPDIVVIRETLEGRENILSIVYEIRNNYPQVRVLFIAGKREPGDALLATLVNYGVYDILYGGKVNAHEIVNLLRNPNSYTDVGHLQPKPLLDERRNKVLFESPDVTPIYKEVPVPVPASPQKEEPSLKQESKKEAPINNTRKVEQESAQEKKEEIPPIEAVKKEEPVVKKKESVKPEEVQPVVSKKEAAPEKVKEQVFDIEGKEQKPPNVVMREVKEEEPESLSYEETRKSSYDEEDEEKKPNFLSFFSKTEKKRGEAFLKKGNMLSKNQILTFIGGKHGVGNTTTAFNTAFALAQQGNRVIYVELNERNPAVHYWYELGKPKAGLDYAIRGIEQGNYKGIEDAIITSVSLKKSNKDLVKNYKKFPNGLDFMFFSDNYLTRNDTDNFTYNERHMKDVYLHLLFQFEYDFVVLDVEPTIWKESSLSALLYSHHVFITITQDVSSIGNTIYWMNELNKHDMSIQHKTHYVLNRFEKAELRQKDIKDWLEIDRLLVVPQAHKEFVRANYLGIPILVSTRNNGLKNAYQQIVNTL